MSSVIGRLVRAARVAIKKQFTLPNFRDSDLLIMNHLLTLSRGSKITSPYSQHSSVYRATREIARRLGSVPWVVETGPLEEPVVVNDPRIRALLDSPNPETTSSDMWEAISSFIDLRGECLGICEGRENPGMLPREIWIEPCNNWDRYIDPDSKVITKWVEKKPALGNTEARTLPFWQVIHFKQFNPESPYAGQSTIAAAMRGIETDGMAEALNEAYLKNGAVPGGILTTDQPMEDVQIEQILQRWQDRYGGDPLKRGRPAVTHTGLKWQQITMTQQDMQYLDQRKWTREDVALVYGVPWEIMGFGKGTFNNFETAERVLYEGVVVPRGNDIGETLSEKLFGPATGGRLRFRFDWSKVLALQERIGEKVDTTAKLFAMGVPLKEASRATGLKLKLGDVPGADVPWVPVNLMPAGAQERAVPGTTAATQAAGIATAKVDEPTTEEAMERFALAAASAISRIEGDAQMATAAGRRKAAGEVIEKAMRPGEKAIRDKLGTFFWDQRRDVLKRLNQANKGEPARVEKALSREDVEAILFAEDQWDRELQNRLQLDFQQIVNAAGRQASSQVGTTWDPRSPGAAEVMRRKLLEVTEINKTTREALRETLSEGIENGESVGQLSARVRESFNEATRERAVTIARTEAATAANSTRNAVFEKAGVSKTRWLSVVDDRTRDNHLTLDGKVLPLGEDFGQFIGVDGLTHPGDPDAPPSETINCRCVAVAVIEELENEPK